MSKSAFAHLHNHTDYSILDSTIRIYSLIAKAKEFGMPAVAITDSNNMFGVIEFYLKCRKAGIKPIIGCEISVTSVLPEQDNVQPCPGYKIVLLCMNLTGYRNLCYIVSEVSSEGFQEVTPVTPSMLALRNEGLICLSGGCRGELSILARHDPDNATTVAAWYDEHFPERYYIELYPDPTHALATMMSISRELDVPLVATADCHSLTLEDSAAYPVLHCIRSGNTIDMLSAEKALITPLFHSLETMEKMFGGCPEALSNTLNIADQCNLELPMYEYHIPHIETHEGICADTLLEQMAWEGFKARMIIVRTLNPSMPENLEQLYQERLRIELDYIIAMRFAEYFLVVADYVNWAKDNGIPVGPGRGAIGGSLVAYALRITEIDPIAHNLLFERYINPERVVLPDIYLDFCMERRQEVLDYIIKKYGRNKICRSPIFETFSFDDAMLQIGRIMNMNESYVKKIRKMYHSHLGNRYPGDESNLPKLRKNNLKWWRRIRYSSTQVGLNEVAGSDSKVNELLATAIKLQGLVSNSTIHASSFIIAPKDIRNFTPVAGSLQFGVSISHAPLRHIELMGLVPFNFLSLKNLTLNDRTLKLIRARNGVSLDMQLLLLDDKSTYEMLSAGNTDHIFQLASSGMKVLLQQLKPSCFEDIVAACALYRPGPIHAGMMDDLIERKHGRQPITYNYPGLKPILATTYGVLVYQEQVMQITNIVAGYSLGQADLFRRELGKKNPESLEKEKVQFTSAAGRQNITHDIACEVFEFLCKYSKHGFNKAHAISYALIAYQSAWLKTHYSDEFAQVTAMHDMQSENWNEDELP